MCWRFTASRESEARTAGILKRPSESRAVFRGRRKKRCRRRPTQSLKGRRRRRRRRERSNGRSIHPPPSSSSLLLLFLPNEENDHVRSPPHLPTLAVSLAGVVPVLVSPFTRKETGGAKNLGAANFAARLQKNLAASTPTPATKKASDRPLYNNTAPAVLSPSAAEASPQFWPSHKTPVFPPPQESPPQQAKQQSLTTPPPQEKGRP